MSEYGAVGADAGVVSQVSAGGEGDHNGHEHEGHASVGFYWMIAAVLTVITLAEVAVFYIPGMGGALAPSLLVMSATKFALVVMFFMHLKFDSRIFTGVFLAGLVLAVFVVSALFVLHQVLPGYQA